MSTPMTDLNRPTRAFALAALLTLCLSQLACHNYYKEGMQALQNGNLSDALKEARLGVKEEPDDPELRLLMALVLIEKSEWARARPHANLALKGLPEDPAAHLALARVHLELGDPITGADHTLDAIDLKPALLKAQTQTLKDNLPGAIAAATDSDLPERVERYILTLQKIAPDAPDATPERLRLTREHIGQKLTRLGRYEAAEVHYGKLAEAYPDRHEYLAERATLLLMLGRDADSEAAFERFAGLGDDKAQRYNDAATRANLRNRRDAAERWWKKSLALNPKQPDTLLKLAGLLLTEGRNEEALEHFTLAIDRDDKSTSAFIRAAEVATDHDRGELAIILLQRGAVEAEASFALTSKLMDLLLRRDRRGDMEDALKTWLARIPASDLPKALDEAVTWLEARREFEVASDYLSQALALPNAEPASWLRLARIEASRKRPNEAFEATQTFLKLSPKAPADFLNAASTLLDVQLSEDAEQIITRGLAQHPTSVELIELQARIHFDLGDHPKEELSWRAWIALKDDKALARLAVGRRYAARGDVDRAAIFLTEIAAIPAHAAEAWLTLGEAYKKRGLDKEMREAFEKYLDAAADREAALVNLLSRYQGADRAEDALRALEVLIGLRPKDADLHFDMAERHLVLGNTDKALKSLQDFVALSKEPVGATRRAARLLTRKGQMGLALELYEQMFAAHGDDPEMAGEIGDLYWELSQRYSQLAPQRAQQFEDASLSFYKRFIEQTSADSDKNKALLDLAERLTSRRQFSLAIRAFEKADALKIKLDPKDNFTWGEALLGLGRAADAEEAFKRSLRGTKSKGAQNFKIGEAFYRAERYDKSLQYLQKVLDNDVQNLVTRAFELMSRIYIQTGERDSLQPLVIKLLELTRGAFNMRQAAAATYAEAGLWELAIAEYRDLLRLRPNNATAMQQLAVVVYMSGDKAAARKRFEEAAQASSDASEAWETIGAFYLSRGEMALALDALTRAVDKGGASPRTLIHQGLVLILQGKFDEGDAALRKGFDLPGDQDKLYGLVIDTLALTPRRDLGLKYAAEATERAKTPAEHLGFSVESALERGDVARALREARKAGIGAGYDGTRLVNVLLSYGYTMEAIELIREQIRNGDASGFEAALTGGARAPREGRRADPLRAALELGGLGRLPMFTRPMLEQRDDAPEIHAGLGLLYAELERLDEATVHLASAGAARPSTSDLELGQIYFKTGDLQKARSTFSRYIGQADERPANFQRAVMEVAWALTFLGDIDEAERFVRGVMARPGRESLMVPVLTEILLLKGERHQALNLIQTGPLVALFSAPPGDNTATDSSRVGDLIDAAAILAGFGFGKEALKILSDVAAVRADQAALLLTLVEIGARERDPRAEQWAAAYLAAGDRLSVNADQLKIRLADAWRQGGGDDKARALLLGLVASHDADLARQALLRLVAMARRANDASLLDQSLKAHAAARSNTLEAMLDQGRTLRLFGFFEESSSRYDRALTLSPTNTGTLTTQVKVRALAGHGDKLLDAQQRASRASQKLSHDDRVDFGQELTQGPDSAIAQKYWTDLGADYPALAARLLGASRVAWLRGDADAGRAALDTLMKQSGKDVVILDRALRLLVELQRWEEARRLLNTFGPANIEPDTARRGALPPLAPSSYLYAGLAEYALGNRDAGLSRFDIFTRISSDPLGANLQVASGIAALKATSDANAALRDSLTYTERALAAAPDAPLPYLHRGELRLLAGQRDAAIEDFATYLARGDYNHVDARRRIATALLAAGDTLAATPHLLALARHPFLTDGRGLSMALGAFEDAKRFKEGLDFLKNNFPTIASNPQVRIVVLFRVAELTAGAGDLDRAIALYERGLERFPDNNLLPNNLAYLLARNGRDLGRAEQLVLRALGSGQLDNRTHGVYLDTLAWIHLKQGKNEQALREQLQALRLTAGSHADALTLYAHLADIYDALNKKEAAAEARYRSRLHDVKAAPILPEF